MKTSLIKTSRLVSRVTVSAGVLLGMLAGPACAQSWSDRAAGEPVAVVTDAAGGVIVAGMEKGEVKASRWTMADGAWQWRKRWAKADTTVRLAGTDVFGGLVMAGNCKDGPLWIARGQALWGIVEWERRFTPKGCETGQGPGVEALAVDPSGTIFAAGRVKKTDAWRVAVVRLATNGRTQWEILLDNPAPDPEHAAGGAIQMTLDRRGDLSLSSAGDDGEPVVCRISGRDGKRVWSHPLSPGKPGEHIEISGLATDKTGHLVVLGAVTTPAGVDGDTLGRRGILTAKLGMADGKPFWTRRHDDGEHNDAMPVALAVDREGRIVTGGYIGSLTSDGLAKFELCLRVLNGADGSLLWDKRGRGPVPGTAVVPHMNIVVEKGGQIVVTGTAGRDNNDLAVAKYRAADGAYICGFRYELAARGDDEMLASGLDEGGNTCLLGRCTGKKGIEFRLARYPTGNYFKPTNSPDTPTLAKAPAPVPAGNSLTPGPAIRLVGRTAVPPADAPSVVLSAIAAGNLLQTKGYKFGGGRDQIEDTGYDCSGSVSYVLIKAGLLGEPRTSSSFTTYGQPGPGRWITIYATPGHVFMTVCGLRLDTGGRGGMGERGPRWDPYPRFGYGWVMRHPPGL